MVINISQENINPTMSNDNDMKEATIALKGMLGIGKTNPVTPSNSKFGESSNDNSTKKKKKSRKKKGSDYVKETTPIQSPKRKTKIPSANRVDNGKKKDRTDKKSSPVETGGTEKFAMSAFQSPPDASSLPLPAFSSFSSSPQNSTYVTPKQTECVIQDARLIKEEEAKKMKRLTSSVTSESQIKALLNISGARDIVNDKNKTNISCSNSVVPVSSSGVNLAALATSLPSISKNEIEVPQNMSLLSMTNSSDLQGNKSTAQNSLITQRIDPLAMLMNGQSYGASNSDHSQPSHPQQHYSQYSMYQQPSGPYHPMMQGGGMQRPQYVTIHVQVPPVLMPGRQMMVPASPMTGGYPVPVVVPQGVQSGMVIPVTIPTTLPPSNAQNGPINVPSQMAHNGIMSPMGSPPSSSYQLHHPQQCYENGLYPTPSTHAQTHHQTTILHQHEKEFLKQQKNRSDSLPITWAAKVGGTDIRKK